MNIKKSALLAVVVHGLAANIGCGTKTDENSSTESNSSISSTNSADLSPFDKEALHRIITYAATEVEVSKRGVKDGVIRGGYDSNWKLERISGNEVDFNESTRDSSSIYLTMPNRRGQLQIDLFKKKVFSSFASTNKYAIYDIDRVSFDGSEFDFVDVGFDYELMARVSEDARKWRDSEALFTDQLEATQKEFGRLLHMNLPVSNSKYLSERLHRIAYNTYDLANKLRVEIPHPMAFTENSADNVYRLIKQNAANFSALKEKIYHLIRPQHLSDSATNFAGDIPRGSWVRTCDKISWDGTVLSASCHDGGSKPSSRRHTTIRPDFCFRGLVVNQLGALKCWKNKI